MTDVHTHTSFSPDGQDDLFVMFEGAKKAGLSYWGISEHFDYDYFVNHLLFSGMPPSFTPAEAYFFTARRLQEGEKDVKILVGAEFGFAAGGRADGYYRDAAERFAPDFIVNSVHTNGSFDYYEEEAFGGREKSEVYGEYLDLVRESLEARYPYDVVGHLGYVSRRAPYRERTMKYAEFSSQLDGVLTAIIRKGKILEINSSASGSGSPFLPDPSVAARYYELGGRKISFASDAHGAARLAENRESCMKILQKIGFSYVTVPCRGKEIKIKI